MRNIHNEEYVCIIDDEPQVLRALDRELKVYMSQSGCTVKTYSSSNKFLSDLDEIAEKVSLIISDLRMPEIKGSDLLLAVHNNYPDIELILLTAYNDIPDIQKAVTAKIRALILKPWEPEMVIAEIEKARTIFRMRTENKLHQAMINKQLEVASEFQHKLLETEIPCIRNAEISLTYCPVKELKVGGDYYDIIKVDDNRFFVMIGDVSGHGVKPSFVTAMLKVITLSLMPSIKIEGYTPAGVLKRLNARLCSVLKNTDDVLMTFSCLMFDTENLELTFSNAGHLPVFVVNSGECFTYQVDGPAMGFSPHMNYEDKDIELHLGDIVSICTDGLLESEIVQSKIDDRIVARTLAKARKSKDFNTTVVTEIQQIRSIEDFHDDVTFISIRL